MGCPWLPVPHMTLTFGRLKIDQRKIQRILAAVFLFLMVSDLGFHLAVSFLQSSADPGGTYLVSAEGIPEPPGGCGIPGDDGTPFHHHHFPTLTSQTPPPLPLMAVAWVWLTTQVEVVHSTSITPIGRAPPARS